MKRVGIYLRVSTNGQSTEKQRRELKAVAARSGSQVVEFYEDDGIAARPASRRRSAECGIAGRQRAPDQHGRGVVDRLARPQPARPCRLPERAACAACHLYLHQQALDTSTPSGAK